MAEQTANITALIDSDLAVTAITLAKERNRPPDWQLEQREARQQHGLVFVLEGGALYQTNGENLTVRHNGKFNHDHFLVHDRFYIIKKYF